MIILNERHGDVWYPSYVEYWVEPDQTKTPNHTVEVVYAAREPVSPASPGDLDIDLGHNVFTSNGLRFWTGTDLIDREEYLELLHRHGVEPGPKWVRGFTADLATTEDEDRARVEKQRAAATAAAAGRSTSSGTPSPSGGC